MAPPPRRTRRAVALLSGGMDSAVAAASAAADGHQVHALSVDYGQRQRAELAAAERLSTALSLASFTRLAVDLRAIGGSALTDDLDVPKDREVIGADVPVTYVPARNTVLLSLALARAEVLDARTLVIGANAVDYSGYPDCRPEFLEAFERVAVLGTTLDDVQVLAPLVHLSKAGIVRRGIELGIPFGETLSCYDPVSDGDAWHHCGRCDACRLRRKGFQEAGAPDPTVYVD